MVNKIEQSLKGNGNLQQNIQTQNVYKSNELSEVRVREISSNSAKDIAKEYFLLSQETVNLRLKNFENIIIDKFSKIENNFSVFKEPAFVLSYRQAQIQAATTDDTCTYNMLCELLIHRSKKQDDKLSQTGIQGAINIVNQISDSSLTALTILTCISIGIRPYNSSVIKGLEALEDLYSSILVSGLPTNELWQDQLDILKAIRINNFGKFKPFKEIICSQLEGYVCVGIEENCEKFLKAKQIQNKYGLNILVKNELLENYYKIPIVLKEDIESLSKNISNKLIPLNDDEKKGCYEIFNLYNNDSVLLEQVKNNFMQLFDQHKHLKQIHEWLNKISHSCELTSIGRVLGHANAQKCYAGFPPLN